MEGGSNLPPLTTAAREQPPHIQIQDREKDQQLLQLQVFSRKRPFAKPLALALKKAKILKLHRAASLSNTDGASASAAAAQQLAQQVSGAAQGAQNGSQQQQHATFSLQRNASSMSDKQSGQLPQSSGSQQDGGTPCSAEQLQNKQLVGQGSALLKLLTEHILQQQQQQQQQQGSEKTSSLSKDAQEPHATQVRRSGKQQGAQQQPLKQQHTWREVAVKQHVLQRQLLLQEATRHQQQKQQEQ
jgi:hypothetical protein